MVIGFIPVSDAFRVDHQDIDFLTFGGFPLNEAIPHPNPFGMGIHCGSYPKAIASFQNDSVQEVGFPCAIEPRHRHDADGCWDGAEEVFALCGELIF